MRKKDVVLMATVTSFESLAFPSKSELRQFAELFAPLFQASSEESKRQAAAALSQCERLPQAVALFIGSQPIGIAAIFLTRSASIDDDTLITIARSQGAAHARAIAQRDNLSPVVIDALVGMRQTVPVAGAADNQVMERPWSPAEPTVQSRADVLATAAAAATAAHVTAAAPDMAPHRDATLAADMTDSGVTSVAEPVVETIAAAVPKKSDGGQARRAAAAHAASRADAAEFARAAAAAVRTAWAASKAAAADQAAALASTSGLSGFLAIAEANGMSAPFAASAESSPPATQRAQATPTMPSPSDTRHMREEALRRDLKLLARHLAPSIHDRLGRRTLTPVQAALLVRFARSREAGHFVTTLSDALSASRWLAERIMLDISGLQLATTLLSLALDDGDTVFVLTRFYPHLGASQGPVSRAQTVLDGLDVEECELRVDAWLRADTYTFLPPVPANVEARPSVSQQQTPRALRTSAGREPAAKRRAGGKR